MTGQDWFELIILGLVLLTLAASLRDNPAREWRENEGEVMKWRALMALHKSEDKTEDD